MKWKGEAFSVLTQLSKAFGTWIRPKSSRRSTGGSRGRSESRRCLRLKEENLG